MVTVSGGAYSAYGRLLILAMEECDVARTIRQLATAALVATALVAIPCSARVQSSLPSTGFELGEPFPTLSFPSLDDGRPGSITDFRGQKVILHVFASW